MQKSLSPPVRGVKLPEIVPIVLRQAFKLRKDGLLSETRMEETLARLEAEELTPRGMQLLIRNLTNGATRFLIKDKATGRVCEMVDSGFL